MTATTKEALRLPLFPTLKVQPDLRHNIHAQTAWYSLIYGSSRVHFGRFAEANNHDH